MALYKCCIIIIIIIIADIARLPDMVSAHQALLTGMSLSLGRRPSPDWRCPVGRPPNRWLDQIRTNTGSPPVTA